LIETKATYHIQLFSGVQHGFATKGDPTVENSRTWAFIEKSTTINSSGNLQPGWAKEQAARSVIEWFHRFNK
jgi:hypothetical protein